MVGAEKERRGAVDLANAEGQLATPCDVSRRHGFVFLVPKERMPAARKLATGRGANEDVDRARVQRAEDREDGIPHMRARVPLPSIDDAAENQCVTASFLRSFLREQRLSAGSAQRNVAK